MQVGTIVRVRRSATTIGARLALIATVQGSEACILWEDDTPRPVFNDDTRFLVTPHFQPGAEQPQQAEETTLPIDQLMELFDFEKNPPPKESILEWKECGDRLLKAGDFVSAVSYYEHALQESSKLQVGSTVLIQASGYAVAAEIDCIDDVDDVIDVTIMETGHEQTVKIKEILISLLDTEDSVQQRILLNLTRCLLQLAETSIEKSRRPRYLRSAVLASTLAFSASDAGSERETQTLSTLQVSALLLRSQAQLALHKYPQAISDLKKILALDPKNCEAKKSLERIEKEKRRNVRLDKRLAKNVSQWVQTAINQNDDILPATSSSVSDERIANPMVSTQPVPTNSATSIRRKNAMGWLSIFAVVLISLVIQKALSR